MPIMFRRYVNIAIAYVKGMKPSLFLAGLFAFVFKVAERFRGTRKVKYYNQAGSLITDKREIKRCIKFGVVDFG